MRGKAFKFGDNISTDHIAPGRLFHLRSNLPEFAKHVLEDADPNFASTVQKGDFVVAGNNFGLGSSREHAPQIIKLSGVNAVLAKSFARIFYRNAINIGLLVVECDTDGINAGDELDLDIEKGILTDLTFLFGKHRSAVFFLSKSTPSLLENFLFLLSTLIAVSSGQ